MAKNDVRIMAKKRTRSNCHSPAARRHQRRLRGSSRIAGNGQGPSASSGATLVPRSAYSIKVFYCYSAPNSSDHVGLVKVGEATAEVSLLATDEERQSAAVSAARARIKEQTNTSGLRTEHHWTLISDYYSVNDKKIHRLMEADEIKQVSPGGSTATEWYATDPDTARRYGLLAAKGSPTSDADSRPIVLREEQQIFVDNALQAWEDCGPRNGQRLWDAKMRFGKTVTACHFIGEARAKALESGLAAPSPMAKVLIVTHRPVVDRQWAKEFTRTMQNGRFAYQDWRYVSKSSTLRDLADISPDQPVVCFASMQDLRGRDKTFDGFKESNQNIFDTHWDLVIIDEAHEGNRTQLAQEVHNNLDRHFTLYLSGTPYKYLVNSHFESHEVDVWDYVMEQTAKQEWPAKHPDEPNPYEELPRMWINALDLSESLPALIGGSADDSSFNLAEMFSTNPTTGTFDRPDDVRAFLQCLTQEDEAESNGGRIQMPFSGGSAPNHKHTLWTLPSVAACKAMQQELEAHPYFGAFTVVNVAGDEEGDKTALRALERVQEAIEGTSEAPLDPSETQTITLTVGRLTTGVTVAQWTAVLLLSNMASAETYMQTIFRVQSAYESGGIQKTECFVYDFAPDRALRVLSEVTGYGIQAGTVNSREAERRFGRLLNFMPVISNVASKDFRRLDVREVDAALKRIYKTRVLEAGFDSGLLFRQDLEALSPEIRTAIEAVRLATGKSGPVTTNEVKPGERDRIYIANNGLDHATYEDLRRDVALLEKTRSHWTEAEAEAHAARKEEIRQRDKMRHVLRTVTVRIPLMIIALMSKGQQETRKLKEVFALPTFVNAFDDESWREFFQDVTKEMVLTLEPAFDQGVLQVAVVGWIDEVEGALAKRDAQDWPGFKEAIALLMARIKNPNRETVFTPWPVVDLLYAAAGFSEAGAWRRAALGADSGGVPATFYDINIKSGLFPVYAAVHLAENSGKSWGTLCDESIYGNARTLAGKWIACTLLGKPRDWSNITIIDVRTELEAEDLSDLSDIQRHAFLIHFLTAPLRSATLLGSAGRTRLTADIRDMAKRRSARDKAQGTVPGIPLEDCRFDHVISNPPYQILDENNETKAHPIWPDFLQLATRVGHRVAVINPGRWLKGGVGTGLHPIRDWLLANPHLDVVYTLPNEDVFPTATIKGDLTIEVIDNDREFDAKMCAWTKTGGWGKPHRLRVSEQVDIPLGDIDFDIVSRIRAEFEDYVEKTLWQGGKANLTRRATSGRAGKSAQDRFGIRPMRMVRDTDYFITEAEKDPSVDYIKVWFLGEGKRLEARFLPKTELQDTDNNRERVPVWKVAISKTEAQMLYRNPGPPLPPDTLCTETWLCRIVDNEKQVKNFQSYLRTYFYRYLVSLRRATQDAFPHVHRFVPDLERVRNPRTGRIGYHSSWTDDDISLLLADVLTEDDWRHIKRTAIAADGGRGDYEAGWKFSDGSTHASLTSVTLDPGPDHGDQ